MHKDQGPSLNNPQVSRIDPPPRYGDQHRLAHRKPFFGRPRIERFPCPVEHFAALEGELYDTSEHRTGSRVRWHKLLRLQSARLLGRRRHEVEVAVDDNISSHL